MSTDKKNIGKILHGLIFQENAVDDGADTETSNNVATPSLVAPTIQNIQTPSYNSSANPVRDEKIVTILKKSLREANLPGPDYLELTDSMDSIKLALSLDDDKALKAAFASLQPTGLTKDIVLNTAQHYIETLNQEQKIFLDKIKDSVALKIEQPQKEISAAQSDNLSIDSQIQQLNAKKDANNSLIEARKKDISQATGKIETMKANYAYTIKSFIDEINQNIERVKTII